MLVTGTPGTGQTYWQLHLLWHLARRGATVVRDWIDSNLRYLLTRHPKLYIGICCRASVMQLAYPQLPSHSFPVDFFLLT